MAKRMVGNKIDSLIFNHWKSNKGDEWPLIGMCNMALGRSLQSLQFFLCKFLNQSLYVKVVSRKFVWFIISQNYEFFILEILGNLVISMWFLSPIT